jgi:hypothetical protein
MFLPPNQKFQKRKIGFLLKTPIFYFYDTVLNSNRSYIALIHARISELDNPAESGLDYLEGDVALNFKQAEKYIRISKDSVAKG